MNTILILEDQAATADWLCDAAQTAFPGAVLHRAPTLADAHALLATLQPDLALVDLRLPDGSGVVFLQALAQQAPACCAIVTTIYSDDQYIFPALRAGAQGYLLKDQPIERFVEALRRVTDGEPPLSAAIAQRLLRVFKQPAPAGADDVPLTLRERETLVLIAKGLRLPEVAAQLGVTRSTAATYIKSIYRKLNVSSRAEATLQASRMGLVRNDF